MDCREAGINDCFRGCFGLGKIRQALGSCNCVTLDERNCSGAGKLAVECYATDANFQRLDRCEELARQKGATIPQIALAWVLAQGDDLVPIPGTKRRTYLEENVRATELKLDAATLAELAAVFPPGAAAGERYPASMMAALQR